jgi:hypothetical protein
MPEQTAVDEPSELTVLCWMLVLCELDVLFWIGVVRGVEALLS